MMDITFRGISHSEAESASALEALCLHTAWSASQIRNLPPQALYIGAFCGDALCGIASAYMVADEVQIMNVAVAPEFRRRGIALGLMKEIIQAAESQNCYNITLEVAENNGGAISLYERCGFTAVGKRKGFYGDISAVIMEKIL